MEKKNLKQFFLTKPTDTAYFPQIFSVLFFFWIRCTEHEGPADGTVAQ